MAVLRRDGMVTAMSERDPAAMRRNYGSEALSPESLDPDPMRQFASWFTDACDAELLEPNAMTLATADTSGAPSARTVLMKGQGPDGFRFFTNYASRKGSDLEANPCAAAVFLWLPLTRQVTVRGLVSRLSAADSDQYFQSRPPGSRLSAAASPQSREIRDRAELESLRDELEARSGPQGPTRPPGWGGFLLAPDEIEFWQGRSDRLHDRVLYRRDGSAWQRSRLAP